MKVGVVGLGSIGRHIAGALSRGEVPGMELAAIADVAKEAALVAQAYACAFTSDPMSLPGLGCGLVVEAAGGGAARALAVPLLQAGCDLMLMSVGALADAGFLAAVTEAARASGRRVHLPSGALAGLDAVRAASVAGISEVLLTTRKPPRGLAGAPWFQSHPVDLDALTAPTVVFEGSAAEAIAAFPANVNVAVALSLAGVGPVRTRVRVVAEPGLRRNVHEVTVRGDFGELRVEIANVPSPENPRTSVLAALAAVATLRRIVAPVVIG
jgi:aspartate dehydrogenase